ncbi:MAG: hypothetical protein JWM95_2814 [Gemmatimonadetes bacterium]|nr:hypothetical protein [Gemmatimonadota bacterium]
MDLFNVLRARFAAVDASVLVGFASLAVISLTALSLRSRLVEASLPIGVALSSPGEARHSRARIIFVFRPAECPQSLEIIDFLNKEARNTGLDISGIVVSDVADTSSVLSVVRSYNIAFPIRIGRFDAVSSILARAGVTRLPVSLVFDTGGTLRAISQSAPLVDDSVISRLVARTMH